MITGITLVCTEEPDEPVKAEVNKQTKHETEQNETINRIILARLEADHYWMQVQLDADKKLTDSKSAIEATGAGSDDSSSR